MKHTHSYFDGFLDNEHRLIHLAGEASNQETPPPTEGQRVEMEAQQHEETEALETPEDAARKGDEALVDAEKGSTDLQADVKKAQDDVSRIRLAAALGSGGLSAEEEHSAAEQRLAEAQTNALMEDHNPMSGGTVNETHESRPDTMNEVEAIAVNVDESSDHVEEQKTNETTSEYMEKMKTVVSKLQEMLAYMKQNHVGEEDATVYSMLNGINNDLIDAGETPEGAQSKAEILNNQPNRLVAMNDQQSILVQYARNQDAITFSRIESAQPRKQWNLNIAGTKDTESPEPGRGGGGDDAGGTVVEKPAEPEAGTPAEGSTPQEQKEDPVANLDKAKNATDSAWQKFMEARDGYFKSQEGAKEGTEKTAKEAIDGLLQSVETEEALMREVGDGRGGEQDASRWHEINGRREQAFALQKQFEKGDAAQKAASGATEKSQEDGQTTEGVSEKELDTASQDAQKASKEVGESPEAGNLKADFKRAIELMNSDKESERDEGLGLFLETLMKWISQKLGNEQKEGSSMSSTKKKEGEPTANEVQTSESTEQRDVIHGPARRARLINAYRAEQQKQPGMTASEFINIKEDAIQKDEERLTDEQDSLSKEEKNTKDRIDILKEKRSKAKPKERGTFDADITKAEQELKEIERKILENKDALDKLESRKDDIVVLKELRDSLKALQDALNALPKDAFDKLPVEQKDVVKVFLTGVDPETYTVNFPTEAQVDKLPKNVQDIIRNSPFYRQKEVYQSTITPSPTTSKATTLPHPIEPSESVKKALEK